MDKRLILSILFLLTFSVLANSVLAVQGVCTGMQTCYCSGRAVSCPCNANPCAICGPQSPECIGNGQNVQQYGNNYKGSGENNYGGTNVIGEIGSGAGMIMENLGAGIRNLYRTMLGEPSIVQGRIQPGVPSTLERVTAGIASLGLLALAFIFLRALLMKIIGAKAMSGAQSLAQPSRIFPTKKPIQQRNNPRTVFRKM